MGWKGTMKITREEVTQLMIERILSASDRQLTEAFESLGFGDDSDLKYFGRSFDICSAEEVDEERNNDNDIW